MPKEKNKSPLYAFGEGKSLPHQRNSSPLNQGEEKPDWKDSGGWTTVSDPTSDYTRQEKYFKAGKHKGELKKSRVIVAPGEPKAPYASAKRTWNVKKPTVVDVRKFKRGESSGVTTSGEIIPTLKKSKTKKVETEYTAKTFKKIVTPSKKWTRTRNK